ncbi:MAG: BNR repeat-containing protein [Thermomicrobiales bacterium]
MHAQILRRLPLGPAYAATGVNTTIFRVGALTSDGARQYATYYDPDGAVVVAARDLDGETWDRVTLPAHGKVADAHNGTVLGVSPDGVLHLAYDHHNNPLHYRASQHPGDIHTFGPEQPMTGQLEERVTYPQFVNAPDGTLYFFYRDGRSGNGRLCLNRYDHERQTWLALQHPLIDGLDRCNPYWWRPAFGPDGALHLAWCWRDTPNAATNHDICYARSDDGGATWRRSTGDSQPLPITPENAEVVDPVPTGANLINQCAATVDAAGRPHLAHYYNDAAGVPQYRHLWHDSVGWRRAAVSRRATPFTLAGGGSLRIPISRPEIVSTPSGAICLITGGEEAGDAIRLYYGDDQREHWPAQDLPIGALGNWEPTYDVNRWRRDGILSLFILPVRQGDHETTTAQPAQTAAVLEVALESESQV